jgi:hypothetical protein
MVEHCQLHVVFAMFNSIANSKMLKWSSRRLCAGPEVTLSQRLKSLSSKIRQTPAIELTRATHANALWKEYLDVLRVAVGTRETDATLSLAHLLLKRGCTPPPAPVSGSLEASHATPSTSSPPAEKSVWAELFSAASFSDVECSAPLAYRASVLRSHDASGPPPAQDSGIESLGAPVDRDLLVMTGGIIPLTQRHRCADGFAFVELLKRWGHSHNGALTDATDASSSTPAMLPDADAIALLDALQLCKGSLVKEALQALSPLILSLTQNTDVDAKLFYLLESLAPTPEGSRSENRSTAASPEQRTRSVFAALAIVESILHKGIHEFLDLERAYRALNVVRKGYTCKHPSLEVAPIVERLCSMMDFAIQTNESDGNPMELDGDTIQLIRGAAVEARVRCLAMEMDDPFAFVEAMDQILAQFGTERSFAMQHEVIQAFAMWVDRQRDVALTESEGDEKPSDAAAPATSMDDALAHMVQTLRSMVEVRPRGDDMDPDSKAMYQHSHALVLTALCGSHDEKWLSEGYLIVVTHKYHQLSIDVDTIRPLVLALSKRGDCRVFNLVDLVTLYCNNKIDFITVEAMFRTCRVAGDYHRAKALYQLMKETVPGFLAKAPVGIVASLRELKIIKPIPPSMFSLPDDGDQQLL